MKLAAGEPWKCRSVERMEIQKRDSHSSHDSLGISPTARDSHIPTAPAAVGLRRGAGKTKLKCGPWKSGNQKAVSTFPPPRQPPAGRKNNKTRGHANRGKNGDINKEAPHRPDNSTGLERPAQANYQHPGWAKSDDRSGPGRMIKLILLLLSLQPGSQTSHDSS